VEDLELGEWIIILGIVGFFGYVVYKGFSGIGTWLCNNFGVGCAPGPTPATQSSGSSGTGSTVFDSLCDSFGLFCKGGTTDLTPQPTPSILPDWLANPTQSSSDSAASLGIGTGTTGNADAPIF